MRTYNFAEKNGNAVITLSAKNEEEAQEYLEEIVKRSFAFRLEDAEGLYEGDEDES